MAFEGASDVLAAHPTVSPAIPEKLPRRLTAKTKTQDEEVAADIARILRETQRETGYSLADDELESSFSRNADPRLLRAVLQNTRALGVQTVASGSTELTENSSLKPCGTPMGLQKDPAQDEDEDYCRQKPGQLKTDFELQKVNNACSLPDAHSGAEGIREEMENLVELIEEALEEKDSEGNPIHISRTKSNIECATMSNLLLKVRAYRDGHKNMITSLPLKRSKTFVRKLCPFVEDLLAIQSMPAATREKNGSTVHLGVQAFLVMLEIVSLDVQHSQELLTEDVILLVSSFLTFSSNCVLSSSGSRGSDLSVSRSGAVLRLDDISSFIDADAHRGVAGEQESCEQRRPALGLPSGRDHSEACSKAFERLEAILVGGYRCSDSALAHFSRTAMLCLNKANAVSLQVSAMGLILAVFRCHAPLRDQLLFEVRQAMERFVSLRENPRELRLREDGSGIRVTSALVVQMIQSACSFESLLEAKTHKDWEELSHEAFSARASSVRSSDFFVGGLVQRFLVDKDSELRSVFQVFVDDVIVLYGKPEWPGAETLLESLCTALIGLVRPPANERRAPGDINVRVACIDVLGALATRIRKLQLAKPASSSSIPQVEAGRRSTLLADLFHRSKADPPAADAFCAWSCRFAAAGKLSQVSFEWRNSSAVTWTRKDVVDEAHEEVRFGFLPSTGLASVLDVVASSLRDPSARLRAKGLMSMSEIGRVDPRQFRQGSTFRTAVEEKCLDVSPSVRESALDLLCRVSIALMELDDEDENFEDRVYSMVSSRLADTSTTVRKRAVIILRDYVLKTIARTEVMRSDVIYQTNAKGLAKDESFIAEACSKLVLRLDDQEVMVGEIACKALSAALLNGSQPGLVNMPKATIAARRLVETTMHIAKRTQPRFLDRLLREHESLSDSSRMFLEKVVFCVLREMLDVESVYRDVDNAEARLKDPVLYVLACSALLASFAQVNPALLKSHCRVLLPALKEVPSKGLEAANARNILSIFKACIPSMENQALDIWAELEEDLTCIVKTTKNDLLAAAAIQCHCILARSIPARESVAPEVAETFGRFLDMARENPVNTWQSCLHSLAPAIHRLGLYSRYLDLSPVVADTHFLRLDYWSSNVEFEARASEFGGAFVRIRESALQSVASFTMGNRRFLPRIVHTWRRTLQMRTDLRAQSNFPYRVLSDLQEMLALEEHDASRLRNEQSTSDNGVIGAEEGAEAGYLVSCVQELYSDIQKMIFCADKRVRLKAVMVFGLSIRQG
uniref:Sister chromatid cohesion protein n=1 Tax=Rhodosorus marinus TaxID=101924 RepID=A0A7S3A209_9RHOD|mmetsp:Transcript_39890/g.158742  ORF Transcript_39890/g.158742 Transcript_39890/m.158742 type:complete len:1257 (+) Transcript_39890:2-3772(+)